MKKEEEGAGANKPASMFQMMNHIQSLISMAVENAKQEEKSISHQKSKSMSFSDLTSKTILEDHPAHSSIHPNEKGCLCMIVNTVYNP